MVLKGTWILFQKRFFCDRLRRKEHELCCKKLFFVIGCGERNMDFVAKLSSCCFVASSFGDALWNGMSPAQRFHYALIFCPRFEWIFQVCIAKLPIFMETFLALITSSRYQISDMRQVYANDLSRIIGQTPLSRLKPTKFMFGATVQSISFTYVAPLLLPYFTWAPQPSFHWIQKRPKTFLLNFVRDCADLQCVRNASEWLSIYAQFLITITKRIPGCNKNFIGTINFISYNTFVLKTSL